MEILHLVFLALVTFVKSNNINLNNFREIPIKDVHAELHRISEKAQKDKEEKIKELEVKREEILSDINKEIDKGIFILQASNDSYKDIQELKGLKQDIEKLHDIYSKSGLELNNSSRRLSLLHNFMKRLTRDEQIRIKNDRKALQKKAQSLIQQLKHESNKQKKGRILRAGEEEKKFSTEKCPRFGYGRASRDSDDDKKRRGKKYPCCRKCCKKSALGCL